MLNITVLCVGKIKEWFYTQAIEEYAKRLGRYCRLRLTEVKDEASPETFSPREKDAVLEKEGARLLEKLPDSCYVIALCVEGEQFSSESLAQKLETLSGAGNSHLVFVIGGSLGLSPAVKARANLRLSFSAMTFPHQLMRVILLEQLYRALNLNNGGKYHK